ncbi:replication protein A 70 kDa DNA-binding subunit A-like [Vicia villosa]|uniref:replication protein A 70 kDa DNA-binding subunit A-like n=1 Tax=Vicia villosa TaxID=3911 RepID=UPI00273C8FDE|nr:replication protein A 70 kDa DNA-binding subunit A-like [Vicia villosa]
MALSLTPGAITKMYFTSEEFQPVLQVIDLKLVQSSQNYTTERYRAVLSDGEFYEHGLLATPKNDLVHSGRLQKGSIVKLLHFFTHNNVHRHKFFIIVDLDVLMDTCETIGKPVSADVGNSPSSNVHSSSSESPSFTLIEELSNWHPFQ